jgi:hypothetical protein
MTSTTTRIIITALAILALAAPIASAMPMRDGSPEIHTGSLAGTTSTPKQDLRNERGGPGIGAFDNSKANVYVVPAQQPQTMKPVAPPKAQPVATTDTDDGTSPLVYILPGLVLIAMLAAGFSFARMSRRPAQV